MRRVLSLLVSCAVLAAFAGVSAAPAQAAPRAGQVKALTACAPLAKPTIKLAYGDRSITVAWSTVPGAVAYDILYSFSSNMAKPSAKRMTSGSSRMLTGLTNGSRYYAQIKAVAADPLCSSVSPIASGIPAAGNPTALTVTVVPAGKDQVRVSWTGQGRNTKVAVIAGSEGSLTKHPFQSAWYPATTSSITLTVPAALRAQLGTGSGNPIFVKVATYNSLTAGTTFPRVASVTNAYRLSLAGKYSWAAATTTTKALRVAEYNVQSVAASAKLSGRTWAQRRLKVAASIKVSGADLLAAVELTTAAAGNGKTQWEDLRDLLAQPGYGGYRIANDNVGGAGTGATKGAHLFYDPTVVSVVSSGIVSGKDVTNLYYPASWPAGLTDRYLSWAKFTMKSTGKPFFAASVHLPAGSSYANLRVREAAAIDKYLTAKAGTLPIVVMGDLNSSFAALPDGPQTTFTRAGYYDASSAVQKANPRYPTANITNQVDNKTVVGYPYTPYLYQYAAPRIDYILVKNSPGALAYRNQLVLVNGKFDPAYQGSDHNLQWADIGIK
ncbi:hypothetical protein E3T33_07385 [Cryobacterium sp. TMT1-2-1]|nr:hypothetical protein E3T33_07385 [Cryobacterium sp. TMT1-2-1]